VNTKLVITDIARHLGSECDIESKLRDNGYEAIAGVDEAGRGPLAGPVVAAAVMIPRGVTIEGIDDSKKLTAVRRDIVFDRILASKAAYAIGIVDNDMIDTINILRASLRAMGQAICKLADKLDFVLVDGNQTIPSVKLPQMAVVGGDALCQSISAASIIAKVTRDRIMAHYASLYPLYSFNKHKGYPTAEHLKELREYGPTPIHRRSYKPVQEALAQLDFEFAR